MISIKMLRQTYFFNSLKIYVIVMVLENSGINTGEQAKVWKNQLKTRQCKVQQ